MITTNTSYGLQGNVGESTCPNIAIDSSNMAVVASQNSVTPKGQIFLALVNPSNASQFCFQSELNDKYLCSSNPTGESGKLQATSAKPIYFTLDENPSKSSNYNLSLATNDTSYVDMPSTKASTQISLNGKKNGSSKEKAKQKWVFTPVVRKPDDV